MTTSKDYITKLLRTTFQTQGQKNRAWKIAAEMEELEKRKAEDNKKNKNISECITVM